jgi:DNA (cytosine-5)-methyltransferase 1
VEGAKADLISPISLCGPVFGLKMYRHRLFESSFWIPELEHPKHDARCTRNGYLPTESAPFMTITGGKHSKAWLNEACKVMGTPWMTTVREVCEAIPPAYTECIGVAYLVSLLSAERWTA